MPQDFYRFANMAGSERDHLYIEGIIESEQPWWDEDGKIVCPQNFRQGLEDAEGKELVVHVNSPGGDLSAGIAMFEMLRQRRGSTKCEISYAGSAASLIPCGCKVSEISPAGIVMIHNPQVAAIGDGRELEKARRAYDAWKKAAIFAYKERIDKTEEEIASMMDEELFLNADAAVELGICDGILKKPQEKMSMCYSRQALMLAEQGSFKGLPEERKKPDERAERQAMIDWANA